MKDYVTANKNEKEIIGMAEKLGYSELIFIGNADLNINSKLKLSSSKRIFRSDVKKDRNLIESKKADLIYDFEFVDRKDATHFRNSGMNHIIAKLMHDNKVSYGLSFSSVLNAGKEEQAVLIGRILQNIRLCRKFKVPIVVASFAKNPHELRDSKDLAAFARVLGIQ